MTNHYDIITIGAGSGGLNIASFTNRIGLKTLLVDKTDKSIGGDCLNFGCVPSKALIHISRLFHDGKQASQFGLRTSGIADIKKVTDYVSSKVEHIREHENADYFRKKGMDVELGEAKFINHNTIKIKDKEFSAKKIIIATGSRPKKLKIPGIEKLTYGKELFTNENIFNIKKLPKRLLVIGGGPIGCELGQAFARLGSKVTMIARSTILNKEPKEVQEIMNETLEKELTILSNTQPIEVLDPNRILVKNTKTNKESNIDFDAILISIGRDLNTDLDLEKAGIEMKDKKIVVDEYLRTTNKNILTCGDIAGGPQFTHAAELHAGVILNNAFSPLKKKLNYDKFSWVTFTDPEIATWGQSEEQLKENNIEYQKLTQTLEHDDRSITDSEKGQLILYISNNKILGGTLIRRNAGEIAQELILATHSNLKLKDIFSKIYAYPTAARINKSIIANHMGKGLSDFTRKLLRWFYH